MTWFGWLFIALTALGALINVARVGKPREPVTHADAVVQVILAVLFILAALMVGTGSL